VDIGDVGFEFGAIARSRGVTAPFKPSTWAQIPAWAKDADGHWALAYTGTVAFAVNTRRTGGPIASWKELLASKARVDMGEVGRAAQANAAVLAAAVALGGDEGRLDAALQAFAQLARQGRLVSVNPSPALMERGEADVFVMWDFNALAYRDKIPNKADYTVLIPSDGSVTSGYTTVINVHAPHPNAARLAREFIFSDAGQLNLARGYARPVRFDHLTLPADLQARLLPSAQYKAARPIRNVEWTAATKTLGSRWQTAVLANAK
jgi:putative spermidine/putrescine transport system substrate-binding protein